jgi:lipopolysaccharide/colanic/teichoic acid biosynthesis glycosyltransferase
MARRLLDITLSLSALVLLSPLLAIAIVGIRVSSPGPILYRARRLGLKGRVFTMYKFRTMHVNQRSFFSSITVKNDPRIFAFGSLLRRLKVDELPQLFNVLKGEMAIIGPRPEDQQIVSKYYASYHHETFEVLPGLASPGSIYYYTHGEQILKEKGAEQHYAEQLLPIKLALDIVYIRESSFAYDLRIILRAGWVILSMALGRHRFRSPPEMPRATQLGLIPESLNPNLGRTA